MCSFLFHKNCILFKFIEVDYSACLFFMKCHKQLDLAFTSLVFLLLILIELVKALCFMTFLVLNRDVNMAFASLSQETTSSGVQITEGTGKLPKVLLKSVHGR